MRTVSILDLITRAKDKADMARSTDSFVTDAEWQRYVDAGYTDLVDQLVKAEIHMMEVTADITTVANTTAYDLETDFYKLLSVDYIMSTTQVFSIPELVFAERNRYLSGLNDYGCAQGYRLIGNQITFYPTPPAGQTYRVFYVPCPAEISTLATSTEVDGIAGWEEYIVIYCAWQAKKKEESADQRDLLQELMDFRGRIAQMGVDRSQVQEIADTTEACDWYYPNNRRNQRWY